MILEQDSQLAGIGKVQWEDEDFIFETDKDPTHQEFLDLLEADQNGHGTNIREGMIVKGNISKITSDYVIVDIGHKSEGEIPVSEFKKDEDGKLIVQEGQDVEVYLDRFEDDSGAMIVSFERAEMLRAWDRVAACYENNEVVEGVVNSRVKGGLSVDIGVKAFLPGSQVDLRPLRNLDKIIGTKMEFKIIKFNKKRGNIVLSRRVLLEQDREQLRSKTLDNLEEGTKLKGIVKNITDYGAFVDLGGIDGLLHITDMSWGRINHPSEIFEVGQEVDVTVLNYDKERQRVSLGFKQLLEDPWKIAAANYPVEKRTQGVVVSLTDYGAFVELEDGIEGLIHVSEMSWSKRVKHPSKVVQIGDEVDVVVLAIDSDNRRISLGMKQIEQNPWEIVQEKYQSGDIIRGKIRNLTDFGMFVGIEEGIDGLIHISDISWTERFKHPGDKFKKGDEVEAKVLQIDPENEKFTLGIKQMTEDPFVKAAADLPAGSKSKGKVTKVTEFGAFIELGDGIEGLIHKSELDVTDVKPAEVAKVGEEIEFIVLASDVEERKFNLSRKAFLQNLDSDSLKQYISSVAEPKGVFAEAFNKAEEAEGTENS